MRHPCNLKLRYWFAVLVVVCSICSSACAQQLPIELLEEPSKILFLGDSITYSGGYVAEFDRWQLTNENIENVPRVINLGLPSETVSGLSEEGHAGGKFPRPDLKERLGRTLETIEPDLVIACYGINCGIYQPFDEGRFQAYKDGIQNLVDKVEFADAKLILITPPIYDDKQSKLDFSYDYVMTRYTEWLVKHGEKEGWHIVDLHSAMTRELVSQRAFLPDFTFQKDAVHPDQAGHFLIAQTLINAFDPEFTLLAPWQTLAVSSQGRRKGLEVWRDAYLTSIGHQRPGLSKGLTLEEAEHRCPTTPIEKAKLIEGLKRRFELRQK